MSAMIPTVRPTSRSKAFMITHTRTSHRTSHQFVIVAAEEEIAVIATPIQQQGESSSDVSAFGFTPVENRKSPFFIPKLTPITHHAEAVAECPTIRLGIIKNVLYIVMQVLYMNECPSYRATNACSDGLPPNLLVLTMEMCLHSV